MRVLHKALYRPKASPVNVPMIFAEIENPAHTESQGTLNSENRLENEEQC
jgi:hypothetical protein